jgi:ATP/ADP translocase
MGTIDEVKEILNTLRVAMSIAFGILIILIGSLIKRYDSENIDYVFWIGTLFVFVLLVAIILIVQKISKKTKEIKDL